MTIPVTQDTPITFSGTGDTQAFSVSIDGRVIYNGRLSRKPGESTFTTYINRIVKDYLSARIELSTSSPLIEQPYYAREVTISPTPSNGIRNYKVYADYSYDDGNVVVVDETCSSSMPLSHIVDPRQRLITSFVDLTDAEQAYVELRDGSGNTVQSCKGKKCATINQQLGERYIGKSFDVYDDREGRVLAAYKCERTCANYALYYLNAHGGYDHLLLTGNVKRVDNLTRSTIIRDVNSTTLAHGKSDISVSIQRTWELATDMLTDAQLALTHHVLGSPHAYLHDLNTREIVPVVITANRADFKSYRNQGGKLSNLTLTVEEATKRERR